MFITETISIDQESIMKLSLEDLILLVDNFGCVHTKLLGIAKHLIVLKKISNYLKTHPDSRIADKFVLDNLMLMIKNRCHQVKYTHATEFQEFLNAFDGILAKRHRDEYKLLFYADRSLEELEGESNE